MAASIMGNRWPCCNRSTGFQAATLGVRALWQTRKCNQCNRWWRLRIVRSERLSERMGVDVFHVEWEAPGERTA